MTRILFICYGNTCRSPMAEFVLKDLVKKDGLGEQFHIESTTYTEESGNPVYRPARRKPTEHGIDCAGKRDQQIKNSDYDEYDLLIDLNRTNFRNMHHIKARRNLRNQYSGHPHFLKAEIAFGQP